jgi:prepilin-type N-terminal cleavage/methylation domain-containing protein
VKIQTQKTRRGFTLVELLVVIGIIALLISILLPSLNKARQQANLIDCSSRLRQMGMAIQIYESENNDYVPMSSFLRTDPSTSDEEQYQWWEFTLGDLLNKNMISSTDGLVHNLSKVFSDVDTVQGTSYRWSCDYTANPRVFYSTALDCLFSPNYSTDYFGNNTSVGRKLTDVKNASNVFAIWDAPQCIVIDGATTYNAYPVPEGMDAWAWYNNGMALNNVAVSGTIQPSLAIWPISAGGGSAGVSNGKAEQKKLNYDLPTYDAGVTSWDSFRFRHMNNTELAALCLDGHVETRLVGSVLRTDIYTNAPGTGH